MNPSRLKEVGPETIETLWLSGFVNRWHTHPDPRLRNSGDTNSAHQHRVALLVAMVSPDTSRQELLTALMHDAPEAFTGDIPWGAKVNSDGSWTVLGQAADIAERSVWKTFTFGVPNVSRVVHLCDRLDAYLFVQHVAPDLLVSDGWPGCREWIIEEATSLGVLRRIEGLIG